MSGLVNASAATILSQLFLVVLPPNQDTAPPAMATPVAQSTSTIAHYSTFLFIHHQLTTSAATPSVAKMLLESEAADVGITIKQYHSDNGVFSSAEFREHCTCLGQILPFSGVGTHHRNGVAERAIQTVTNMAQANMLHATLHWPDRSFIDLWPLVMNSSVWVHNKFAQHGAGLSPEELFSGMKCLCSGLPRAYIFGCPVYDSRARQGIFGGFSPRHSTSIPLILNPRTQHISPQFHVIFDDAFTTIPSLTSESDRDHCFEQLFETARECYIDPTDITPTSELLGCPHLTLLCAIFSTISHWLVPHHLLDCLPPTIQRESQSTTLPRLTHPTQTLLTIRSLHP
eukprot:CCRYP_000757-RA/>CCRYP_000757-RA protein AED:0.48 eAED:0.43 QI:0/0/0/1/0/0/2/0/342